MRLHAVEQLARGIVGDKLDIDIELPAKVSRKVDGNAADFCAGAITLR